MGATLCGHPAQRVLRDPKGASQGGHGDLPLQITSDQNYQRPFYCNWDAATIDMIKPVLRDMMNIELEKRRNHVTQ